MLDDIHTLSAQIAMESQAGRLGLKAAIDKIPGFWNQTKTLISEKIGEPLKVHFAGSSSSMFTMKIKKTDYTDFKDIELFVPQGLKTRYVTYLDALMPAVEVCGKIETSFLIPFNTWLGEKLGHPSSLSSIQSTFKAARLKELKIEEIEKQIQACFVQKGRRESTVPYQQAIGRQAEWEIIHRQLAKAEELLNETLHQHIKSLMRRSIELLDTLTLRIESDPETYRLSAPTAKEIAEVTYEAARVLEFYGLTKYRVQELSTAVHDSVVKLESFVK